jgi:FkbM family methyltransferase
MDINSPLDQLGILVLGFNRPLHLQSVLESLRLQDRLHWVHVWIDGTQGRGEYRGANDHSVDIANRYSVREVRALNSHLGIEKMMLDALDEMTQRYTRVLVLEDDCFPLQGAIDDIESSLMEIESKPEVYSVYGHHFGTEPEDNLDFTRFQGWGWAAHSARIKTLLPELKRLFMLSEKEYLALVASSLNSEIRDRLDRTPGRDVLGVLSRFFSWDSATAFLTARDNLVHRRTPDITIKNTGIVAGIGHFHGNEPRLRNPPLNMITLDEAWRHYDRTTPPCDYSGQSYGLEGLDRTILDAIDPRPGFFVELGAFDGATQSNSVLLESLGWRGLLIEANPGSFAKCVKARPQALVELAACVASTSKEATTTITDVGLMSMTADSDFRGRDREEWLARGEGFAGRPRQAIEVATSTLSRLLDKHAIDQVDLLLLDVEGAELEVLKGLEFDRHAPRMIVAEDTYTDAVADYLSKHGYRLDVILSTRKHTRDCLYKRD